MALGILLDSRYQLTGYAPLTAAALERAKKKRRKEVGWGARRAWLAAGFTSRWLLLSEFGIGTHNAILVLINDSFSQPSPAPQPYP